MGAAMSAVLFEAHLEALLEIDGFLIGAQALVAFRRSISVMGCCGDS